MPINIQFTRVLSKNSVKFAIIEAISNLTEKYKLPANSLIQWKEAIMQRVTDKVEEVKIRCQPQQVKPILKDETVAAYLTQIQSKFVLVPIDKAANNIAIICKKFYIEKLLLEIGLNDTPSETYKRSSKNIDEVIGTNIDLCKSFHLEVSDVHRSLPFMYWMPKMHYSPCRARFIVASAVCSTKPLSKIMSTIFSKIFEQISHFHAKCQFYKNYNRFWVVQNSKSLLMKLNKLNSKKAAKKISTFDFSTLYTKLPHNDLIKVLQDLVEFVFNGGRKTQDGNRKYLTVKGSCCFFSRTKHGNSSFTKNQIKMLLHHLISETFFTVGNLLFKQCIGIPMGIDPAPFWANLYLYHYENLFMTRLIRTDRYKGFKFKNAFRFIDDACTINDSDAFNESYQEIYPPELQLKCEHSGDHATFLELDITIVNELFVYKLFDKRDAFPFFIIRMPDLGGNIPSHIFYGSIMSEILRIARSTLHYNDFIPRAVDLFKRMINQGAVSSKLSKQVDKVVNRHPDAFTSFNENVNSIKIDIEELTK